MSSSALSEMTPSLGKQNVSRQLKTTRKWKKEEIKDPWPNVEFVKNMSTLNVTSVTFTQQKRKKNISELKKK